MQMPVFLNPQTFVPMRINECTVIKLNKKVQAIHLYQGVKPILYNRIILIIPLILTI